MYMSVLLLLAISACSFVTTSPLLPHPLVETFNKYLEACTKDASACEILAPNVSSVCIRLANEHAQLLLHDVVRQIFQDAFYVLPPNSTIGRLLTRIIGVHKFSQGDLIEAQKHWLRLDNSSLVVKKMLAAQMIISGRKGLISSAGRGKGKNGEDLNTDALGMQMLRDYTDTLYNRFVKLLLDVHDRSCINSDLDYCFDDSDDTSDARIDIDDTTNEKSDGLALHIGDPAVNAYLQDMGLPVANDRRPTTYLRNDQHLPRNISTLAPFTERTQDQLLFFLFQEAEGLNVRAFSRLDDLVFSLTDLRIESLLLDSKFRFHLGVGLAKLGLFDLSLAHVSLSATPWELPLYRFRAHLVFPPIHGSIFSLAQAVDNFEQQAEQLILYRLPKSSVMVTVCNSLNEAALALQSLPLLSLTGYSSPRDSGLGQSPVAIPVLLSEVFRHMCPPAKFNTVSVVRPSIPAAMTNSATPGRSDTNTVVQYPKVRHSSHKYSAESSVSSVIAQSSLTHSQIRVGIIGGSFDSNPGRIVAGLLKSIPTGVMQRDQFFFISMCLPTPRDAITDQLMSSTLFDGHINIPPNNKTEAVSRILDMAPDILIFADASYDSRVFALAHERLALFQMVLWGWSCVTLGIPTIDYYIIPEPLFAHVKCNAMDSSATRIGNSNNRQKHALDSLQNREHQSSAAAKTKSSSDLDNGDPDIPLDEIGEYAPPMLRWNTPHELFNEQVLLLQGNPPVLNNTGSSAPFYRHKTHVELLSLLTTRYLLPASVAVSSSSSSPRKGLNKLQYSSGNNNNTHYYIFPGSVKHLHPEFDPVLKIILITDPHAVILLAVVRVGRDNLPITHTAVKHDLMHPTMPIAAVTKLKQRLRQNSNIHGDMIDRIRVLPPLDIMLYQLLLQISVAVLDPFPVGMHVPILDAVEFNVPIVSAPLLQECTSRHVYGMLRSYNIGHRHLSEYPASAEDYAFYALSLQQDMHRRNLYRYTHHEIDIQDATDQRSFRQKKVLTIPKKILLDTGAEDDDEDDQHLVDGGSDAIVSPPSHGTQLLNFMARLMNSAL